MIICVLKRILHKRKSIFIHLLESSIPPRTAAALRIIICKRPVPHFDNQEKHMKSAFLRPNEIKCVLSVKESNFNEKKNQHLLTVRADGADPHLPPSAPSLTVSLTIKYSFFFTTRMSTGVRQLGLGEHIERFCNHILMRKKKVGKVAKEGKRAKGTKVADRK